MSKFKITREWKIALFTIIATPLFTTLWDILVSNTPFSTLINLVSWFADAQIKVWVSSTLVLVSILIVWFYFSRKKIIIVKEESKDGKAKASGISIAKSYTQYGAFQAKKCDYCNKVFEFAPNVRISNETMTAICSHCDQLNIV